MRVDNIEPDLPECDAAYLAGYLWEVGPTEVGGMGPAPLSHSEIAGWQENTGIELTSWEARTLRCLSLAYINQTENAKKPTCPPPWLVIPKEEARDSLARRIRDALRG